MNDQKTALDTEVLIVGGGPAGMGLAIELGQRGINCVVAEPHAKPQPIPKGQNLTQRTMEHFHFWQAEDRLRAAKTIPKGYGIGGLIAYGTLLGEYHYDWMQRELVRPYYFTDNERLPQYATEAVLRERAAELRTVTTLYGWSAERVSQDALGVEAVLAERKGSERKAVKALYAVGCDGSKSLTREQTGITQTRSDHDRLMVLLVFRSTGLDGLLSRYPGKSFYCVLHPDLGGYWRFFGRVDLGTTWFFHAPVPLGTTRDNYDFKRALFDAAGAEFDVEFEHIGFWDLRFALADRYSNGRVFIAGDAAHSHPPYGGYGINTGFEDVTNLGWKLEAALRGWGGAGLLGSYGDERRPVFESTARDFIARAIEADGAFLQSYDPAQDREAFERHWAGRSSGAVAEVNAFEPHYEGSPIVFGPADAQSGATGHHSFAARAGHHLTPQLLPSGENIYDALGPGFTLLAFGGDQEAPGAFEAAAKALRVPLKVVTADKAAGCEKYEAGLVLVRPDQFVAWAGDSGMVTGERQAEAILRKATGAF